MASQKIRFAAPPGETITIDVFSGDPALGVSAAHSNLACTEATNAKGIYETTNAFTNTLNQRCYFVKKIGGVAFGADYVTMVNADGTYDSEGLKILSLPPEIEGEINMIANAVVGNNAVTPYSGGYYTIVVKDTDDTTVLRTVRYNPTTGHKYIV